MIIKTGIYIIFYLFIKIRLKQSYQYFSSFYKEALRLSSSDEDASLNLSVAVESENVFMEKYANFISGYLYYENY